MLTQRRCSHKDSVVDNLMDSVDDHLLDNLLETTMLTQQRGSQKDSGISLDRDPDVEEGEEEDELCARQTNDEPLVQRNDNRTDDILTEGYQWDEIEFGVRERRRRSTTVEDLSTPL